MAYDDENPNRMGPDRGDRPARSFTEGRPVNAMRAEAGMERQAPPIQRNLSKLSNTIDGLDEALGGLYSAIEPVMGPEFEKYPGDDGEVCEDRIEGSEVSERLDRLIRQLESITKRVRTTQGRVEL